MDIFYSITNISILVAVVLSVILYFTIIKNLSKFKNKIATVIYTFVFIICCTMIVHILLIKSNNFNDDYTSYVKDMLKNTSNYNIFFDNVKFPKKCISKEQKKDFLILMYEKSLMKKLEKRKEKLLKEKYVFNKKITFKIVDASFNFRLMKLKKLNEQ